MRLDIQPLARDDIESIYAMGAEDYGVEAADTYIDGLATVLDLLAGMPHLGRLRDEIDPPLRLYRYRAHHIVYDVGQDAIVILRILHGSANWIELI